MTFLWLLAFAFLIGIEAPGLITKKQWRELVVFLSYLTAVFILALLLIIGVNIPSPIGPITYLVRDVLHLNY